MESKLEDFLTAVLNIKKGIESTFPAGASPRGFKNWGVKSQGSMTSKMESFKCHKKGHSAPNPRQKIKQEPKVRKIET